MTINGKQEVALGLKFLFGAYALYIYAKSLVIN